MKKTIIALIALAGVSGAVTEDTVNVVTSLMPNATPTWCGSGSDVIMRLDWDPTFSGNAANEAAILTNVFDDFNIASDGYYAFNQYGHGKNSGGITLTNDILTIKGPSGNGSGSMFFVAIVSVSNLLHEADFASLNSITLSLTGVSGSSSDSWFSVYSMDSAKELTTILELAVNGDSSLKSWSGTKTYTINADSLEASDKVVLLARHNDSAEANVLKFSDIKVTANLSVPEPTTATLSLLALAGLAVRRRRR